MIELESISINGFKSIPSLEDLKLGPITLVIGPNGAGKSNFIEVFAFLNAIREGRLQNYVAAAGGAEKLLHFGSKTTKAINIHLSFKGGINQYRINLIPVAPDELIPDLEVVYFWDKDNYTKPYGEAIARIGKEAGISGASSNISTYVRIHLSRWRLYHFHDTSESSPMKKIANINDNKYLRTDGSNLASFLFFLSAKHEESYSLIRRTVMRVAPFFEDFILEPRRLKEDDIILQWRHKGSDAYFDASSFSDGTLRFIALATLLLQPKSYRPSVILIDEPELGLHPYAITLLSSLIKQAATETQVILSTQSPLLLDNFEPKDVLVADRVSGGTHFTRLDSGKLTEWLEDYSLGQLWEKNEFGGRP